jgi:hypothetical protein
MVLLELERTRYHNRSRIMSTETPDTRRGGPFNMVVE